MKFIYSSLPFGGTVAALTACLTLSSFPFSEVASSVRHDEIAPSSAIVPWSFISNKMAPAGVSRVIQSAPQPTDHASVMVLGAGGRQASAVIYSFAKFSGARHIAMVESDAARGLAAFERLRTLLRGTGVTLELQIIDSSNQAIPYAIKSTKENYGLDLVLSCLPYFLNLKAARATISAGAHYADLGGHLETSLKIRDELGEAARVAGLTILSGLGLAPGLSEILVVALLEVFGIDPSPESSYWKTKLIDACRSSFGNSVKAMNRLDDALIYCGGLPQNPLGLLKYQWIFSPDGVRGNLEKPNTVLLNGKLQNVEPLSMREIIDLGFGPLEAAVTVGATGQLPWTLLGKVNSLIYRTVRHLGTENENLQTRAPSHWDHVAKLRDMGWFEEFPVPTVAEKLSPKAMSGYLLKRLTDTGTPSLANEKLLGELGLLSDVALYFGTPTVRPRDMFARAAGPEMHDLKPDLVVLRVLGQGAVAGRNTTVSFDLLDKFDPMTEFFAMARTTGFGAEQIASMVTSGKIRQRGYQSLETVLRGKMGDVFEGFGRRGLSIKKSIRFTDDRTHGGMTLSRAA